MEKKTEKKEVKKRKGFTGYRSPEEIKRLEKEWEEEKMWKELQRGWTHGAKPGTHS